MSTVLARRAAPAAVAGKRAIAVGQAAGSREPTVSVTTVTSPGHISAGLTSTVSSGRCRVSRQVSSLMTCSTFADRGLTGLADEFGRRDGAGRVVGEGEQQHPGPAALGPDPADGLQQGVRVGHAAALRRGRHVEGGPSEEPRLRRPPGGARPRHQDVAAERGEQREQQRLGAGRGRHVLRPGVQPAPPPVAGGRRPEHRVTTGQLGRGAAGGASTLGDQVGQGGQSHFGGVRTEPDGATAFPRSARHQFPLDGTTGLSR